jgi:excisionase family DNA binding protein
MPKIVVDTSEFHSVDEAAEILGRGVATIWRHIRGGKIQVIRIAGRTLIPASEIERVRNSMEQN